MRATVLQDPAFVKQAGRFVWLDLDTERPESAPFLRDIPIEVWPSFLVVDFETGQPVLKWLGTATAPQLAKLLQDGESAARQKWTGGNSEFGGERDHAANELALRGVDDPLDGEFRDTANTVFGAIPDEWLPHVSSEEEA